ncbi:16S rRNA (uracil(1498)-N(3))-methyltransferase [Mycoplasma simbae]|uniref:16S rRNA (uracil(1498)-N(3))-methyltransferase n=1 Tax=Mycoplasma simbae TaxID=36744 RepID=UPI00049655F0|nr:16S rRNA (uracil(1498)-N(3))-methyltransferase [Mycoplasma simbae]
MHRFFCDRKENEHFVLDESTLHHVKVARLQNENFLINYDNNFYVCSLVSNTNLAKIIEKVDINHEFSQDLVLSAPIIKPDRFEWMLEKSVELGVKHIIPMRSQYVNNKLIEANFNEKKYVRYRTKIKEAAQQSFRNIIPTISPVSSLKEIVNQYLAQNYTIYVAHEKVNSKAQLSNLSTQSVLIAGPEGGLSDQEIEWLISLNNANVKIVSLGKTILRAETAAISMLANVREEQ